VSLRTFAGLGLQPIPYETTLLNFRHLLEANDLAEDIFKQVNAHLVRKGLMLKRGSIVDATIIAAPSSTKNESGERDPEMHQTKKGNQWHFPSALRMSEAANHPALCDTVRTMAVWSFERECEARLSWTRLAPGPRASFLLAKG